MKKDNRTVRVHMLLSEQEAKVIRERMAEVRMTNQSAFFRKMAVEGYIIRVDMSEFRALTKLLGICSKNLNQYVKRANETGSVYAADIEDLRERLGEIKEDVKKILKQFEKML